jgi:hypothetical protein
VTFTSWRVDPLKSDASGSIPQEPGQGFVDISGAPVGCLTLAGMDEVKQVSVLYGVAGDPQTGNTGQLLYIQRTNPLTVIPLGAPHATPVRALAFHKPFNAAAQLFALRAAGPAETADSIVQVDPSSGAIIGAPLPVRDAAGNGLLDLSGLTWYRISGKFYASRILSSIAPYRSELLEIDPVTGIATSTMTMPRLVTQLMAVPAGSPAYAPPVVVPGAPAAMANPVRALTLDANADGLDDVAVLGTDGPGGNARVAVWLNTSTGFAFDSAVPLAGSYNSLARDAITLDANGAGGPDIVVPLNGGLRLLTNAGPAASPHFTTSASLTNSTPPAWTMTPLDADAWPELITSSAGNLTVFQGQAGVGVPSYTFPANGVALLPVGSVGQFFVKMSLADLDGQGGTPDLLVRSSDGLTAAVNQGGGLFTGVQNAQARDQENFPFFTGDFDGNGTDDILSGFGGLTLYQGLGSGHFGTAVTFPTIGVPHPLIAATGDLSSDGIHDVAVFSANGVPRIHFFVGQGGTFTEARRSPLDLPQLARVATVGDFDGDGLSDDIVLATPDGSLLVLTQK